MRPFWLIRRKRIGCVFPMTLSAKRIGPFCFDSFAWVFCFSRLSRLSSLASLA